MTETDLRVSESPVWRLTQIRNSIWLFRPEIKTATQRSTALMETIYPHIKMICVQKYLINAIQNFYIYLMITLNGTQCVEVLCQVSRKIYNNKQIEWLWQVLVTYGDRTRDICGSNSWCDYTTTPMLSFIRVRKRNSDNNWWKHLKQNNF